MRINIYVELENPKDSKARTVKYELVAEFAKTTTGYGNDTCMSVKPMYADKFNPQTYDIRYDTNFDKNKPELYVAQWVYNYWSGENGSYQVKELRLKRDKRYKNALV